MGIFKEYRRSQIAEMREVTKKILVYLIITDLYTYQNIHLVIIYQFQMQIKNNGSPKIGDMIARNPKDYSDQWLVAEQYFKDNFEQLVE